MFEQYKREIKEAREVERIAVLFHIYEAAKADFYNDKISPLEYNELKKMILGF